ncbi:Rho-GTPase-activating protein 5 [Ceratocystis fimbriata CBS 114723]|uniref:Rho-GTPase-activating protein 5 n=1 Tax=Ceratocystis fimbriata CBS 114723 TaxID=1035309 RepID=A0A2C5X4N9_9PEZI|nr:Rho-GTPase-activating protein 5 [Ceratocystis fimbriata CBS 114723]
MTSGSFLPHEGSPPNYPSSPPTKRDLKSWWKSFKMPKHQDAVNATRPTGIFGVPLRQSITYANVAISLVDEENRSYIYGYVPIVVAKCGVFLKDRATGVEGIFRLSGSEKRIKELKTIFDSPDRYGKGLVWEGYTVHDAANVLRRYLNDLPEPVVPLDLYEKFRQPLKGAVMRAPNHNEGSHLLQNVDPNHVIARYQNLITELPPLNRQLLLYLLDLLAVFAAKADENRMNSQNLAAIFQPGMLSHPDHDMLPEEYRLNQSVIIFLIENQDHFLIGMQGTEADEQTKQDVEYGAPQRIEFVSNGSTTVHPSPGGLVRTGSNASAGAESVRRDGKLRRNRSVSSRHSRQGSGARTPRTPTITTTPSTSGGLGRSNTVPSKRSPGIGGPRHPRESPREGSSTLGVISDGMVYNDQAPNVPSRSKTLRVKGASISNPIPIDKSSISSLSPSTSSYSDNFQSKRREHATLVKPRPTTSSVDSSSERRQLNKLRKKRMPDSANPSAQSSSTSLSQSLASVSTSPTHENNNPLESPGADSSSQFNVRPQQPNSDISASPSPAMQTAEIGEGWSHPNPNLNSRSSPSLRPQAARLVPSQEHMSAQSSVQSSVQSIPQAAMLPLRSPSLNLRSLSQPHAQAKAESTVSTTFDDLLKTAKSPPAPASLNSSFNEGSDIDQIDESSQPLNNSGEAEREKKRRWRLSRPRKEDMQGFIAPLTSRMAIGVNSNAETSSTSVGSGVPRTQENMPGESCDYDQNSGAEDPRPIDWIKNKYRDVKEIVDQKIADQRRAKSPPPPIETMFAFNASFTAVSQTRGRSIDLPRHDRPADQVQAEPSPVLPPRPRNSEDSTKPILPPHKSQDDLEAPMLPPRRSPDDHKVLVRPRKPVPSQVPSGSATSSGAVSPAPLSPNVSTAPMVERMAPAVQDNVQQSGVAPSAENTVSSNQSAGKAEAMARAEPVVKPGLTLAALTTPATVAPVASLGDVSPVDDDEDDVFPVPVSPIVEDEDTNADGYVQVDSTLHGIPAAPTTTMAQPPSTELLASSAQHDILLSK